MGKSKIVVMIKLDYFKNISQFMIFGDDEEFMRAMATVIVKRGRWKWDVSEEISGKFRDLA